MLTSSYFEKEELDGVMTVADLIERLQCYRSNTPVVFQYTEPEYSTVHEREPHVNFDAERKCVIIREY